MQEKINQEKQLTAIERVASLDPEDQSILLQIPETIKNITDQTKALLTIRNLKGAALAIGAATILSACGVSTPNLNEEQDWINDPTPPSPEAPTNTETKVICGGIQIDFVTNPDGSKTCKVENLAEYLENGEILIETKAGNAKIDLIKINNDYQLTTETDPMVYLKAGDEANDIILQDGTSNIQNLEKITLVAPSSIYTTNGIPDEIIITLDTENNSAIIKDNSALLNTFQIDRELK